MVLKKSRMAFELLPPVGPVGTVNGPTFAGARIEGYAGIDESKDCWLVGVGAVGAGIELVAGSVPGTNGVGEP